MKNKILKKDSEFIWHPFTQEKSSAVPILVKKAKDEKIIDIDGNEYIDLISSWWVNTHGHCRNEIIKETYQLLNEKKSKNYNFNGYIEGNHLMDGKVNVIVSPTFTVNIISVLYPFSP